jgi:hypothetical protein
MVTPLPADGAGLPVMHPMTAEVGGLLAPWVITAHHFFFGGKYFFSIEATIT